MRIYNFLIEMGIPPNMIGFHYMLRALEMLLERDNWHVGGRGGIYDVIAKQEGKGHSWRTIERLCRHAKLYVKKYDNMTLKEWLCWATLELKERE